MERERRCSVEELVALVPYQLGFHPADSVVVVMLDGNNRARAFARLDVVPFVHRARLVHELAATLAHHEPAAAVVIAYGDEDAEAQAMAQAMALDAAGVPVPSAVVCAEGQWRLIGSQDWTPLASAPPDAAEAVANGRCPLPSRAAKVAVLAPVEPSPEYAAALESAPVFSAVRGAGAWAKVLDSNGIAVADLEPETLAVAVHSLQVLPFRDLLLAVLAGFGRVEDCAPFDRAIVHPVVTVASPFTGAVLERLLTLYRITPTIRAAAELCNLVAAVAWVHDGTLTATEAIERAQDCDSDNELARLLGLSLAHALNPLALQRYFAEEATN